MQTRHPCCAGLLLAGASFAASAHKPGIDEQPGSASLVQGVTESPGGIGCMTSAVKPIALKREGGGERIEADAVISVSLANRRSRRLCVDLEKSLLERALVRLALSRRVQKVVLRDGSIALSPSVALGVREPLGL